MRKAIDIPASKHSGGARFSSGVVAAIALTLALHAVFLLFKKAPMTLPPTSATPPLVTLLPVNSKTTTEAGLLEWMDILDPKCFIKPDRSRGFSLALGEDSVNDIRFVPRKRRPRFGFSASSPLPSPTESEREHLRKLWSYEPMSITPVEPSISTPSSEYPLWLLDDDSRLPQLFAVPERIRSLVERKKPPRGETVLKARFFDGDFFPEVFIAHSCGNKGLDAIAKRALTFRGSKLGFRPKPDGFPLFISVKWKPMH